MRAVLGHAIGRQAVPVPDIREIPSLVEVAIGAVPIDEPILGIVTSRSRGPAEAGHRAGDRLTRAIAIGIVRVDMVADRRVIDRGNLVVISPVRAGRQAVAERTAGLTHARVMDERSHRRAVPTDFIELIPLSEVPIDNGSIGIGDLGEIPDRIKSPAKRIGLSLRRQRFPLDPPCRIMSERGGAGIRRVTAAT